MTAFDRARRALLFTLFSFAFLAGFFASVMVNGSESGAVSAATLPMVSMVYTFVLYRRAAQQDAALRALNVRALRPDDYRSP